MEGWYRVVSRAARRAAPLLAIGDSKLARGMRARRNAADRLTAWAREHRDARRPLLWIHAPSVGEGLQALAVLEALYACGDPPQAVFTHFSPSAEGLAARMPADFCGVLPWDVADDAERVMAALRPALLCFTKTEVWPVLARAARKSGAATALVAATLPRGSSRGRWPTRSVLSSTLGTLDLLAAVAEPDARRFVALGTRAEAVHVTGDPGVDSAADRIAATNPDAPHLSCFQNQPRPTLVAGSTWPADEAVLIPACVKLRRTHGSLRIVVAPHEPKEEGMRSLEHRLRGAGWHVARLSDLEHTMAVGRATRRSEEALADPDAVVVDRIGVLAELYTVGDVACVGGGFHAGGLHSVLEPAAAGVPTVFGPRHEVSHVRALLERGAARVVDDAAGMAAVLGSWMSDRAARRAARRAALDYIRDHKGAAARTSALLFELINGAEGR